MKEAVRQAMEEGALGLSTGLMYLPGNFATTEEVVELARVTAPYRGLYDSHIRDPANRLIESLAEAIEIAESAGVTPHPAHVKAVSMNNFAKGPEIVALVEEARERGVDVTVDQYPYDGAASRVLISILVTPPDLSLDDLLSRAFEPDLDSDEQAGRIADYVATRQQHLKDPATRERIRQTTEKPPTGTFSWVDAVGYSSFRIVVTEREDRIDRMLVDVAEAEGLSPFDLIADMILEEGALPKITLGAILEEDVRILMQQPWTIIASDGTITGFDAGQGHPRSRGTFPRVLGRYVREWNVLTLEDAVRKMTSLPAKYLRMRYRGVLAKGFVADLVIFNPDTVIDRSTWAEPSLFSEGIVHVLVNGNFALKNGKMTFETNGQYLPRD
jgi:N-acyl-D-aspartate/D-glutamate deacylase